LKRFLHFAVEQHLNGGALKETVIGVEVYGRSPGYDPHLDSIVRMEAAKLRSRLAEYYAAEGRHDPVVIEIPKGTYVPAFRWNGAEAGPASTLLRSRRVILTSFVLAVFLFAGGTVLYRLSRTKPPASGEGWLQLTAFESATNPALSPDGRMLAFVRGPSTFFGPGEVYVKLLPDSQPLQLTNDGLPKYRPVFSPDGSRIAYTVVDRTWDTWVVPTLGGEPRRWLANASGLNWIGSNRILFSEIKSGNHMALVTATESRTELRDIFVPPHKEGMAHLAVISPNRRWILLAEMQDGKWLPCRLVPFDGSSSGRSVGPGSAGCIDAAWSRDGQWMFLNSNSGGAFHPSAGHSKPAPGLSPTAGQSRPQSASLTANSGSTMSREHGRSRPKEMLSCWREERRRATFSRPAARSCTIFCGVELLPTPSQSCG
jgi:hypothetical protein